MPYLLLNVFVGCSITPDDADDYLTMQGRAPENTHSHEQHAWLEDIHEVFEEDNKSVFEMEYQNSGGLQRDQRPSNRTAATSINKSKLTLHYTELRSKEMTEHNYATISDPQTLQKEKDGLIYYTSINLSTLNITDIVNELTEIPTEKSLPQLKAAEGTTMAEHDSSSFYCGLKGIPKPWNGSYENISHDKYIKVVARNHNGEENIDCKPEKSMNDEVEWNYVTINDTVAEKGALTTNSGFCQPKQKSN